MLLCLACKMMHPGCARTQVRVAPVPRGQRRAVPPVPVGAGEGRGTPCRSPCPGDCQLGGQNCPCPILVTLTGFLLHMVPHVDFWRPGSPRAAEVPAWSGAGRLRGGGRIPAGWGWDKALLGARRFKAVVIASENTCNDSMPVCRAPRGTAPGDWSGAVALVAAGAWQGGGRGRAQRRHRCCGRQGAGLYAAGRAT